MASRHRSSLEPRDRTTFSNGSSFSRLPDTEATSARAAARFVLKQHLLLSPRGENKDFLYRGATEVRVHAVFKKQTPGSGGGDAAGVKGRLSSQEG